MSSSTEASGAGALAARAPLGPRGWRARTLLVSRRIAPQGSQLSVLFGFGLVFLMLIPPGIIVIDGISMFATTHSLATGGHLHVQCGVSGYNALPAMHADVSAVTGRGGHCYSLWYPLTSFLAVPPAAAGQALGHLAGQRGENVAQIFALIVPALCIAGAAALTAAIARAYGAGRRGAVAAACAFAFGTEALTYSRTFFAEPLAALLVAGAVYALAEPSGRRRRFGYAALALAVLAKPQLVLVGPALGAVVALRARSLRSAATPALASAAGMAAYLVFNWLRFADALKFGGDSELFKIHNFVRPAAIARVLGLYLVSPGRGLFLYSPVAVVGVVLLWRHRRTLVAQLSAAAFAAVFVVYIGHYYPYGGHDWGDRYLLPTLPLLCAPLALAGRRAARIAAVLVAVGLIGQIPTTLGFYDRTYTEHADHGVDLAKHRWSLAESPLVSAWPAMVHQLRDARHSNVRALAHRAGSSAPRTLRDALLLHVVALWWWLLPAVGIPWWLGALTACAVMAAGLVLIGRGARAPPERLPSAAA